jgi:hypothetical protein
MRPEADERATTSVAGHRRQIAICKAASDLRRLAECGVRRRGITLHDAFDGDGDQQIPSDDAVELPLIQQATGSCEPAGCGSDGAPSHESKPQPEGRSSGPFAVAAIEECLMCARGERLAIVIPAHQVGRDRESLEVFGVEWCVTISRPATADTIRPTLVARTTSAHAAMSRGSSCSPLRQEKTPQWRRAADVGYYRLSGAERVP